jgi:site-specific recombinase XerD
MSNETTLITRDNGAIYSPSNTERNPVNVYLASLAPSGRRSMAAKLQTVARAMGQEPHQVEWAAMRFEHVIALRSKLQEAGYAPAHINATLCALRGVSRAAWHLGQLPGEEYHRIKDVRSVRGSRLPAGRALSSGEVIALLDSCARDSTAGGARDAAIIALLVAGGLRRSEASALDLADYNTDTGALKVRGKGDKERVTYLTGGAAAATTDWIRVRGTTAGALLCPVRKSGEVEQRRISAQAIYDALLKRAREASVREFSPHDLRRTFVSDLLDAGADISAVQKLAGHANVQTTARYDRRGEEAKRKAAALIHLPYRPRRF